MDCQVGVVNCDPANISSATEAGSEDDLYYDDFLRNSRFIIQRILIPIVCILGIIVNSLTILVFSQRRLRTSTNIYLRALATFDLIYLTSVFALSFYRYNYHHPYFLYYQPYGLFITDFASNTSVWLTAAFTIERFFVVSNPMKILKYASTQVAQRIVVLVAAVCFVCTLSTVFENRVVHVHSNTTNATTLELHPTALGSNQIYMRFISTFSAIFFVLIPFVTIATLNCFLVKSIRLARNIREHLSPAHVASEIRTTFILVVVVVMFLVCQGPTATIMIVSLFVQLDNSLYRGINNIFNLLVAINACSNFFLYVGLSVKFRQTFLGLLFSRINAKLLPRSFRDQHEAGRRKSYGAGGALTNGGHHHAGAGTYQGGPHGCHRTEQSCLTEAETSF
ncbi:hypothetical protein BV898_09142 [Hypsibius exemplaris]|uniref:G-protein coupled receptors family 1 profile domain-containing protein n=1 Tax=Hypsibius exemplaris TaxID=2072580 RepID=A0A1W0WNJ1_HYPEX|nr:hypothetical protein BV898_09142 [Hypsibius exemplaris]